MFQVEILNLFTKDRNFTKKIFIQSFLMRFDDLLGEALALLVLHGWITGLNHAV